MPRKKKISQKNFLEAFVQRKGGLESFWGKCLKQFRIPENINFPIFEMRNEMLQGKVCIGEIIVYRVICQKL